MLPSESSGSEASSPPPIFDQPPINSGGIASDESTLADGSEDAWAELKVCNVDTLSFLISLTLLDSHTLRLKQNQLSMLFKAYYPVFGAQRPPRLSTRTSPK
jgi:hypothetical protein